MSTVAVIGEAFERKATLGGGFRAVVVDKRNGQRHESEVLGERSAAVNWVRRKVCDLMGDSAWAPGYVYRPTYILRAWV